MKCTSTIALALTAVLVGCQQTETQEKQAEPAAAAGKIRLAALPNAEVSIDGKVVGETPMAVDAAAGDHEILLRSEGFEDLRRTVAVESGKTVGVDGVLIATDPTDPVAIAKLADGLEVGEMSELEPVVKHRGANDADFVVPGYPRGNVRMSDLASYRIDVGAEFDTAGKLMFKRGKKVLFESDFDPEELTTKTAVPQNVINELKTGAQVTWGFYPEKGKAQTAKFKVVKDDPRVQKRIDRIETRLAGQPEMAIAQLRAQVYLNKRLPTAAYLEGLKAVELAKGEEAPPSQALAVMQAALQKMKLRKTPLWDEVEEEIESVPDRVMDRRTGRTR